MPFGQIPFDLNLDLYIETMEKWFDFMNLNFVRNVFIMSNFGYTDLITWHSLNIFHCFFILDLFFGMLFEPTMCIIFVSQLFLSNL